MDDYDPLQGEPVALRPGVTLQVCHQPGDTPAIVFLHGGLGNRFNLRSQYEFALSQGWQALTYDLAGHGQSEPYNRYSIGRHCRDLTRLLRRFHIQRPVLCGHSYGVPLALEWGQRHPTAGMVLIAGGTHDLDPWWEVPLMQSLRWGGRHLFRLPWLQRWVATLTSTQQHPTIQQCIEESPIPFTAHPYHALTIFWGYNFFSRRNTWKLHCPTLIISGGEDPTFTAAMAETLTSHFSSSRHLHIPQAGHLVMAEYPNEVNGALLEFRASIKQLAA